jgi:hypothetical protein
MEPPANNYGPPAQRCDAAAERESVDELTPAVSGRWRVSTRGSQHVFDLDERTYRRSPLPGHGRFSYDECDVQLTRVERWPRVGSTFLIWVDDPEVPELLEHWHQSSEILRIVRAGPGE